VMTNPPAADANGYVHFSTTTGTGQTDYSIVGV
jgi:hypothetical protein